MRVVVQGMPGPSNLPATKAPHRCTAALCDAGQNPLKHVQMFMTAVRAGMRRGLFHGAIIRSRQPACRRMRPVTCHSQMLPCPGIHIHNHAYSDAAQQRRCHSWWQLWASACGCSDAAEQRRRDPRWQHRPVRHTGACPAPQLIWSMHVGVQGACSAQPGARACACQWR